MVDEAKNLKTRPPVVVVVGHVDHGKSTLLEAIKEDLKITSKESGGITQHIGAYEAEFQGKKITFIDTPGHEAFSAMRQRGASVADIAVLVVDATDAVKAQTKEAVKYVKEAKIPMVVAINKIDRMEAQPEKIKRELAEIDVLVESMAGKIPSVNIAAKTGQNIKELLETILIVAEMENLKTDLSLPAEGVVIEALLDAQKGPVATVILKNGVLKQGDAVGTLSAAGKIKNLFGFQGKMISEALPSQPVQILGFENVPKIGEKIKAFEGLEAAKTGLKKEEKKKTRIGQEKKEGEKVLNLIIKTDVLGSLEAIENILKTLPQDKIAIKVLKSGVGNIETSDIKLAENFKARIYGFRVKIDEAAKILLRQKKFSPKVFEVIYEMVEEMRKDMEKALGSETVVKDLGKMEIIATFGKEKNNQIVGGKVVEGVVQNHALIEVTREEKIIGKGRILNLQQEKKDMETVKTGKEAGILFAGNVKIKEGDVLRIFVEEQVKQTI